MPLRDFFFFFNDTATTEIYTLSLHDALPISIEISGGATTAARPMTSASSRSWTWRGVRRARGGRRMRKRSGEHTSELQSRSDLVCRLLLEKKKEVIFQHF